MFVITLYNLNVRVNASCNPTNIYFQEMLPVEKRIRTQKILDKLLIDAPAELNLAADLDIQNVGPVPTTMFIQQCSQEVGWLRALPECIPMKCPSPKYLQNGHFLNGIV